MSERTDWDNAGWMHIHAQPRQHAEASIRGTRAALAALRDALNAALADGAAECGFYAADGEGYAVKITRIAGPSHLRRLPYTDPEFRA